MTFFNEFTVTLNKINKTNKINPCSISFTVVSEELVRLLQERHELKEQLEMRKIAIEQLVRFQSDNTHVT